MVDIKDVYIEKVLSFRTLPYGRSRRCQVRTLKTSLLYLYFRRT